MRNFPVKNRRTRYGRSLTATPSEPQRLDECPSGSASLRVPEKHRKQSGDTQQQSVHDGHNEGAQAAGTTSRSRSSKRHTPSVTCPGSRATGAVSVECSLHWRRRLLVSPTSRSRRCGSRTTAYPAAGGGVVMGLGGGRDRSCGGLGIAGRQLLASRPSGSSLRERVRHLSWGPDGH
jgi:hypothetical protein